MSQLEANAPPPMTVRRPPIVIDGWAYRRKSLASNVFRRCFDLFFAGIGLLVGLPLFGLIAVLIKVDSPGPVFYRQVRVGRYRRRFWMWKFRKMHADLPSQGPSLTLRYDFRMTRLGRILERTKLDELPQLINVLQGHMSVIGPRPEVEKFVEHYAERWSDVLSVKPGIFGPNQLRNRNESELYPAGVTDVESFYLRHILPDKLEVDAQYARAAGPVDDVLLMVRCLLSATFGTITWRTVVTMRQQAMNFLFLSAAGVGGMVAAHVLDGEPLADNAGMHALLLAVVLKPMALLALRVPKSLAVSLTAEDLLRLVRCAIGAGAGIVIGMFALGHTQIDGAVFALDTTLFLGVMLLYKLVLYTAHLTFRVQQARALLRRMVIASAVLAPVPMLMEIAWSWKSKLATGAIEPVVLLIALLVRPTTMLIMGVPVRRENKAIDVLTLQMHLIVTTLIGSGLVLLGSATVGSPLGHQAVLFDALVFHLGMMTFALRQQAPLMRHSGHTPSATQNRRERLVIAGTGIELGACVSALAALPETDYEIVGIVTPFDRDRASMVGGHPVLGELTELPQIMNTLRIDRLIVVPNGIPRADLNIMRRTANTQGCTYVAVPLLAGLVSRIASGAKVEANGHHANGNGNGDVHGNGHGNGNGNGNGHRNGHANGNGNGNGHARKAAPKNGTAAPTNGTAAPTHGTPAPTNGATVPTHAPPPEA